MSSPNDSKELIEVIKSLFDGYKASNEVKNAELQNEIKSSREEIKALHAKLDLFRNLDTNSRDEITNTAVVKKAKLTRPSFFKMIFIERRDEFMNILYTQDEIDAIFNHNDVKAKKSIADKNVKAAALLYLTHIRDNVPEGRSSAFNSIYDKHYASA